MFYVFIPMSDILKLFSLTGNDNNIVNRMRSMDGMRRIFGWHGNDVIMK